VVDGDAYTMSWVKRPTIYIYIYIPCTLNYKRKNDMCICRHLCCCFTFLFRCTYFSFSCWILECTFFIKKFKNRIKIKIKSYLLVGHYMVLAIHTQQKQQQQPDCLDWLPYLPTSDINLSSNVPIVSHDNNLLLLLLLL